jgi:4-hydroxy-3-polyprenylbenzoate decarboxylase
VEHGAQGAQQPACQELVWEGPDVDLARLPIQHCWPGDVAPLVTWGLVITQRAAQGAAEPGHLPPAGDRRNQLIMRWLAHRGGALDFRDHCAHEPRQPYPVAVALGADPATILGAVTPVPDSLSEYQFAGLLRGARTEVAAALGVPLQVPASAEIVLEGHIQPDATTPAAGSTRWKARSATTPATTTSRTSSRCSRWTASRMRKDPIYHSTYTGKPPDEPAVLGVALNEVFMPLLQRSSPRSWTSTCRPRAAATAWRVVRIKKAYPGHARRVMMGVWSHLRQFMYTKFIVVVDDDVNVRDWKEVIWAMTTRMDPARDTMLVEHTPIDYLDFASPVSGLGSKMGMDATNKWPGETSANGAAPLDADVQRRMDDIYVTLGL